MKKNKIPEICSRLKCESLFGDPIKDTPEINYFKEFIKFNIDLIQDAYAEKPVCTNLYEKCPKELVREFTIDFNYWSKSICTICSCSKISTECYIYDCMFDLYTIFVVCLTDKGLFSLLKKFNEHFFPRVRAALDLQGLIEIIKPEVIEIIFNEEFVMLLKELLMLRVLLDRVNWS